MTSDRWDELESLLEQVLAASPDQRTAVLDSLCATDSGLRSELESLLESAERAPAFLDDFARAVSLSSSASRAGADAGRKRGQTEATDPLVGCTIGGYSILERIASGGMGIVYEARDPRLERKIALKFLPAYLASDEDAAVRFVVEARAAAALDHPNICAVHEVGETDSGQPFIAMALYSGETLAAKIARGPLPTDEAVDYAAQTARGLACAHAEGILHRDIKPGNLFVTSEGTVKILDFGLAKTRDATVTKGHRALGTVSYMSPEQVRGEELDPRSDLWSLGVVLHEMLTGRRPFVGGGEQAVVYSILHEDPEGLGELRPELPGPLRNLVARMLSKNPARRPETAEAVRRALENAAASGLSRDGSERRRSADRLAAARRRALVASGSVALLLGAWAGASLLRDWTGAPGAADRALTDSVTLGTRRGMPFADAIDRPMIVVLPFDNYGPPEQEFFAAGVTDEITSRLAASGSLGVISRTSAIRYARTGKTAREIAEDLGVDYVLEGAVRWASDDQGLDRVRITTQLIRASDDLHIWAQPYDREIADMFEIQSEIAGQVVERVRAAVGNASAPAIVGESHIGPPTEDLEAYSLYMRGRFHRQQLTREGLEQASEYLQRAIDRDPTLARAYAELVRVDLFSQVLRIQTFEEIEPRARARLARALDLDASAPEVQFVLGRFQMIDGDWPAAEETYRRLIELRPSFAEAYSGLGEVRGVGFGDLQEAVRLTRLATLLDPLSPAQHQRLSRWLYHAGDYEGAVDEYERMLELDPEFRTFAAPAPWNAYCRLGRHEEAILQGERHNDLYPDTRAHWLADLASVYAEKGRRVEAIRALEEGKARGSNPQLVALAYAVLGEPDSAFAYLESVYWPTAAIRYVQLKRDPRFESLRSDPRWALLMGRLKAQWGVEW